MENIYGETYNNDALSIIFLAPPEAEINKTNFDGHCTINNTKAIGTMQAAIAIGSNFNTIENTYFNTKPAILALPDLSQGFKITSNDIIIRNAKFENTNVAIILDNSEDGQEKICNNITIENLILNNFDDRNESIIRFSSNFQQQVFENLHIKNVWARVNNKSLINTGDKTCLKNSIIENITFINQFNGFYTKKQTLNTQG